MFTANDILIMLIASVMGALVILTIEFFIKTV